MEGGENQARKLSPLAGLVFYGVMAVVALVWGELRGAPAVLERGDTAAPLQALYGIALGIPVVLLSTYASLRLEWAQRLNAEFREILGPLTSADVMMLAGGSAIGEEMLFRGAMQPTLGLWMTTAVFGLVHFPPRRDLWPWSAAAAAVGLGLGGLYEVTGSILAPLVAHFTVNWFNLHALAGPGAVAAADPS